MRRVTTQIVLRVFVCLGLLACQTPTSQAPLVSEAVKPVENVRITLVATNDLHGWVQPHVFKTANGVEVTQGGLTHFSSYVKILREENPEGVLLLDAGDIFQGTLVSNLTEGEVVIDAMNELGFTAAAMGNHEFDYGPVGDISVATSPDMDAFGALKARIAQARFPILAANIYEAQTGERPSWLPKEGLKMVDIKGIKVGLVGLLTPTTPSVTNPVNVSTLRFGSLVPEMEAAARALRAKGAEVLVAMVHAGGRCERLDNPQDTSSCDLDSGEIFEALRALPPRTFDAVVAGHTHQAIGHFVHETPVVESYGLGRYFSTIDLFVNPRTKKIARENTLITPVIPVCHKVDVKSGTCDAKTLADRTDVSLQPNSFRGKPIGFDLPLEKRLTGALQKVESAQKRRLGLKVPVTLERNYERESALGSFLADSLRDMERADVALLNSGGLRADLKAGDVTYGDIYEVLPFDNTVATVEVTGAELVKLIHAAYGARKGVFQVSGLEVRLSQCPGHDRVQSIALPSGKSINRKGLYKVVMPDFLARGGDGMGSVLASLPPGRVSLGEARQLNFRDALVAYWQGKRPAELVAPAPGRIQFENDGSECEKGDSASH